jgi:hypothetical protein
MIVPVARINAYRDAVIAAIRQAMPKLMECSAQFGRFNLEELETNSIRAPAVRFGVLSAKVSPLPAGTSEALLNCAAFAVTEGRKRDEEAWAIAEAICVLLRPAQLFGLTHVSGPADVAILPVVTGRLKQRAVSIIAIEWKQTLRQLGANIFDEAGCLVSDLYLTGELEADDV